MRGRFRFSEVLLTYSFSTLLAKIVFSRIMQYFFAFTVLLLLLFFLINGFKDIQKFPGLSRAFFCTCSSNMVAYGNTLRCNCTEKNSVEDLFVIMPGSTLNVQH